MVTRTRMILFAVVMTTELTGACQPTKTDTAPAADAQVATDAHVVPRGQPTDSGTCDGVKCASGQACVYEAGCASKGKCGALLTRNCNVAIAMCSCARHETFYGPGGCAGQATESWELYACACSTDDDCRGGQRCVPVRVGRPSRPGATRECRAPDDR